MEFTDCENPVNEPTAKMQAAAHEYHDLKSMGTVEDIMRKYGVTRPTLLKWAEKFPPQSGGPAPTGTAPETDPAEVEKSA